MIDFITSHSAKEELIRRPTFMITLDVELGWGFVENKKGLSLLIKDDSAVRRIIERLLDIFEKNNIAATWAIVGHLFLDHCEKEDGIPHKDMPRCNDNWYFCDPCTNIRKDPLYYGKDIVERIMSSSIKQEIAYHSFSHCNFSECSQEVAEAEIKEGLKLAKKFGIKLESFVFPYDKKGHLDILGNYGFKIYRNKGSAHWDFNQRRIFQKITGALDQIVIPSPVLPRWTGSLWEIPSSMIFSGQMILARSLASRAKLGIYQAVRSNKVFHISLHPWNLINLSVAKEFEKLLLFASKKRDEGYLQVITMRELASSLRRVT